MWIEPGIVELTKKQSQYNTRNIYAWKCSNNNEIFLYQLNWKAVLGSAATVAVTGYYLCGFASAAKVPGFEKRHWKTINRLYTTKYGSPVNQNWMHADLEHLNWLKVCGCSPLSLCALLLGIGCSCWHSYPGDVIQRQHNSSEKCNQLPTCEKLPPTVEQGGMAPDGAGGYLEMAARTDLGG
jgi:hypothetical protein